MDKSITPRELFVTQELTFETCRTCVHREIWALNDHSSKVVQCCNQANADIKQLK